ncbi:S8 family peptidase [Lentzea sp. NPDC102401]|uniref:S8 family peptidase n=1 Tax=Lentzea sp. NPDC102401 TaxID=3364128 RepID=UPI003815BFC7
MKRNRGSHGAHLQQELSQVVAAPRRLNAGVDPDLVFKIKSVARPKDGLLEDRGLQVLGETVNYTYFVLSSDEGATLGAALRRYTSAGTLSSLLDLIEDIEPYGPEDRRGPGLALPLPAGSFLVDIEIWPSGSYQEAQRRAGVVETVIPISGGRQLLRSISARRSVIRAQVNETGLNDLLSVSVVEQVRTPPVPFLDFRDWRNLAASELTRVEVPSATVGVLDDAPAVGHPLLAGLVHSVDLVGPADYAWQQPGDHGTEVVGRVLFPRLHEQLRDVEAITAHGSVRVARILEPDPQNLAGAPRFATRSFPHDLVEEGIRHLHKEYGVKVFNLSIGYSEPFNDVHLGALTEVIDELARELDIVIVVPTGNVSAINPFSGETPSGHHVGDDYPAYLDTPEHRIAEPAPAALAITVGSVALSGAVAELPNRLAWKAIAEAGNISPFSRTGPGIGVNKRRRNKPDVVHYGGNFAMNDSGIVVPNDPGAGVVSTAFNPATGQMFKSCNGTSYAAPAVARAAADVQQEYPDASANLIRALVALGAKLPDPANNVVNETRRSARFGLGLPGINRAIVSDRQCATMTYDGNMPVDTVRIHPVPVPEIFRRGSGGERYITIALAFDPPVRRQRREYLAATMQVDLYRDVSLADLEEILRKQQATDSLDLIKDRRRPKLLPGSDSVSSATLQLRKWTAKNSFVNDDEVFYVAVTHRAATWARDNAAYKEQSYALTVTLEDRNLVQADLYQMLTQQVRVPARLRIRV